MTPGVVWRKAGLDIPDHSDGQIYLHAVENHAYVAATLEALHLSLNGDVAPGAADAPDHLMGTSSLGVQADSIPPAFAKYGDTFRRPQAAISLFAV